MPLQQSHLLLTVVYDPDLFERDQLFNFIVHLIAELLNNFFVGLKADFKELFSRLIDGRRYKPTPRPEHAIFGTNVFHHAAQALQNNPFRWCIRGLNSNTGIGIPKRSVPAEDKSFITGEKQHPLMG